MSNRSDNYTVLSHFPPNLANWPFFLEHAKVIKQYKNIYLRLKNDAASSESYLKSIEEMLPILLNANANALNENEVGVAYIVNHLENIH